MNICLKYFVYFALNKTTSRYAQAETMQNRIHTPASGWFQAPEHEHGAMPIV